MEKLDKLEDTANQHVCTVINILKRNNIPDFDNLCKGEDGYELHWNKKCVLYIPEEDAEKYMLQTSDHKIIHDLNLENVIEALVLYL